MSNEMNTVKKFGGNLSQLLGKKGWTYEDLAEKADISRDTVSHYVSGKLAQPKLETLIKIAQALDTSIDSLLGIARRQEPINARQEAKVVMENLLMACIDANLCIETDVSGRTCMVIANRYISDFVNVAIDKNVDNLDDARKVFSEMYENEKLVIFNREVMSENECVKMVSDLYIQFSKAYAHYNSLEDVTNTDEEALLEKFHQEYEQKDKVDDVIEWGYELARKHHALLKFHSKPFKFSESVFPEWKLAEDGE